MPYIIRETLKAVNKFNNESNKKQFQSKQTKFEALRK